MKGKEKVNVTPKVFISYSHDSEQHKRWVKEIATYLRKNGVDAILDQWDLQLGSDLANFMEHGLSESDRVLIISTDNYIAKANSGKGGVGYEKMIVTAKILQEQDTQKFIPVVRNVSGQNKLPVFLSSRLYIDLSDGSDGEEQRIELLKELHKAHEIKPPIGPNPFIETKVEDLSKGGTNDFPEESRPLLKPTESTQFFSERFSSSFPGVRGVNWFKDENDIEMRLCKLLQNPLAFEDSNPIWWWRKGNLSIKSFKSLGSQMYLMDWYELKIAKIAAVNAGAYYQKFVYVETEPMTPTGLYPDPEGRINDYVNEYGYCNEEYGLYNGNVKINRSEYDDGATVIDGKLVDLGENAELRVRYITPYNFLIAPHGSPINNNEFDDILKEVLNEMLSNKRSIDTLVTLVLQLPKRQIY